ncbi:MAG TPA: hypothetical protein VMY38_04975, partial [Gemmatimonadaceae bacterium]|nr:hypothetical protein [Gemmatimonadaceae bacterium]
PGPRVDGFDAHLATAALRGPDARRAGRRADAAETRAGAIHTVTEQPSSHGVADTVLRAARCVLRANYNH